jgi:dTDP-4-amino-4,6-dideoxygalactose transaminase
MMNQVKKFAKVIAQQTIGRLPPPPARLEGKLAKDGGIPVRNTRYRPWPGSRPNLVLGKVLTGRSHLWKVLASGIEGLPQPMAKQFAERWAAYCHCRFALMLPHGTDALRIALAAALEHDGLDYGGEVIVPNLSFIASATSVLDRRLGVALVDVKPDTLLLDPKRVEEAIIPGKTRAIMAVHLFGQPADMTALRAIADRHNLRIIEDAAQSHGATWHDKPVGSLGDAAGFSFQTHKNLSCGEGGALTTNSEEIYERAWSMHNAGRSMRGPERWEHHSLGWNCRPTEWQAAILLDRLMHFDRLQEIKRRNLARLQQCIADVECLVPQRTHASVTRHGAHMFIVRYLKDRCGGQPIDDFLSLCGAEGALAYRGYSRTLSEQPVLQQLLHTRPDYVRALPTPVADEVVSQLIYIPHNYLTGSESDMVEMAATFRKVWRHYRS